MKRTTLSDIRSRPARRAATSAPPTRDNREAPANDGRYRAVVENAPYGIYRVTVDGRFVALNPALSAIVGYSVDELLASNIASLYADPGERERLLEGYESRPTGASVDVQWRRKNGQTATVRAWVYAERDSAGVVKHFDGYVEDVTTLQATERALRQAEKLAALGQLVSGVAHELNNPLSAILLFTEDLLTVDRAPEEQDALTIIAQQARRSRAIVRDLLCFARSAEVVREAVEPRELAAQIERALEPQLASMGVTLHVEVFDEATSLNVDRAGMEQVLTNLIMNAAQAVRSGGNVWLNAGARGRDYLIEVIDDGPGIAPDAMGRLFEPFFTTKPIGQGTGLGLAVSLGVVQQHGGTIVAENRGPDQARGARFAVQLPMCSAVVPGPTERR